MRALITDPKFSPELRAWAAKRIPHIGSIGFREGWAICVPVAGQLAAVVVYHDWVPDSGTLQLSMAAADPRWCTRGTVGRILGVAFESEWPTGRVRKIWTAIPSTSPRVIEFNQRLGLRKEGVLRHHVADGVHTVVCGIMVREWRRRYGGGK